MKIKKYIVKKITGMCELALLVMGIFFYDLNGSAEESVK